jgi:hypothetical protein
MTKPAVESDLRADPGFLAYVEARTELKRLEPFIVLRPEVAMYEAFYLANIFPTMDRL